MTRFDHLVSLPIDVRFLLLVAFVGVAVTYAADDEATGIVAGRVTRADNGAPVAAAEIFMKESGPALADAAGHYELHHHLDGNHGIWINAKGLAFQRRRIDVLEKDRLDGVDWILPPSFQIRGRVVDEQGNPVASARISIPGWEENQTIADADGNFLYDTVRTYPPDTINAESPDCDEFIQLKNPSSDAGTLVLCRRSVAILAGMVVDPEGQPAEGIRVHLCLGKSADDDDDDSGREFITTADGRFRIPMAAGNFDLFAYNWQKTQIAVLRHVTLADSEHKSDFVIWLNARPEIDGRIQSGNPELFAQRELTVRPVDLGGSTCYPYWFYESSRTDTAGRFRVRQLLPGHYQVDVFTSRGKPPIFSQTINVTQQTAEILINVEDVRADKVDVGAP